jgi:hypothetical protein
MGIYVESDDSYMKYDMGVACGKDGGQERCIEGFGGETSWEETTWKT